MSGAERVVYIDLRQGSELLGKSEIVLGFFFMEADVLNEHGLAVLELACELLGGLAHHVGRDLDFLAQNIREILRYRRQRILHVELALRTAHVGAEDHLRIVGEKVLDGGEGFGDALGIGNVALAVERDVKVTPDQNPLAGDIDIFDGLFVESCHRKEHPFHIKFGL